MNTDSLPPSAPRRTHGPGGGCPSAHDPDYVCPDWHFGTGCAGSELAIARAEVARLQAENGAMRELLVLGRRVMDGLMAGSNNDHSVWEGRTISDRWFELRDEFRARLDAAT